MIGAGDRPALPRGVRLHWDRVRGTWALLAPERAIRLDDIGHAILVEVAGARSVAEIAGALAARFERPWTVVPTEDFVYDQRMIDARPEMPSLHLRLPSLP